MATYAQLIALNTYDPLHQQIKMACCMTALTIQNEAPATTNHTQRVAWAKATLANPDGAASQVFWSVLAANAAATIAAIQAATDAQVQAAVDAAVTNLLGT